VHGDHREEIEISNEVYIYSLCAALNSCNLGFDIGINTSAAKLLQNSMDLSDSQIEIFMGSLNLFGMVGALSSQFITDYLGRKKAFQVAALIFIVGVIPTAFAQNFTTLIFGRVFVGLGIGFGLAIDPLYISEISPAGHRGHFVTYSELATNVGILIGFSCGLIFSRLEEDLAWRVMLLMGIVLPIIVIFLALFIMPESPRWLVQNNRMQEARVVLDKLYPPHFDTEELVEDIKQSIDRDLLAEHAVGWQIILHPTPAFKRILVVGIGMALAHQIVGVDAIQYYLIFIIEDSGLHSRTIQGVILVILGFLKMAFIILAGHFFDIKGRKPLIFASLTGTSLFSYHSINYLPILSLNHTCTTLHFRNDSHSIDTFYQFCIETTLFIHHCPRSRYLCILLQLGNGPRSLAHTIRSLPHSHSRQSHQSRHFPKQSSLRHHDFHCPIPCQHSILDRIFSTIGCRLPRCCSLLLLLPTGDQRQNSRGHGLVLCRSHRRRTLIRYTRIAKTRHHFSKRGEKFPKSSNVQQTQIWHYHFHSLHQ